MTKQDLQKELKEKVKEGVKPSHLKKLKRSKSADDIPTTPSSLPLSKSQSNPPIETKYPYTTLISQQQELERLAKETQAKSNTIALLRKKIESLETNLPTELAELDNSLFARHKNLKDWFTQYSKNKKLDSELSENINEASTELLKQDKTISQLRSENKQLKLTNQSLQKDLNLTTKLAESRKVPYYSPEDNWTYLKYGLYSLAAVVFSWWLMNSYYRKEN